MCCSSGAHSVGARPGGRRRRKAAAATREPRFRGRARPEGGPARPGAAMISAVAALAEVAKFDAAAERALRAFRRNAIVKVDTENCTQCGELDNYWNTIDSQLPRGNMWRADCTADSPPPLCAARWQTGQPRFEAWDGEKFELFAGKPDIQTLNQWAIASLRHFSPPARLAAETPDMGSSKGTLFVSPTQEGTEAQTANPQIPFARFSVYGDAFPAPRARWAARLATTASVVDVGCGHGLLVEAQREGEKIVLRRGQRRRVRRVAARLPRRVLQVQDFAVDGATLPPTDIVTSFEVGGTLPPAGVCRDAHGAPPRLVFSARRPCAGLAARQRKVGVDEPTRQRQPLRTGSSAGRRGCARRARRAAARRALCRPGLPEGAPDVPRVVVCQEFARLQARDQRGRPRGARRRARARARHRRRPLCRPLDGDAAAGDAAALAAATRDGARPSVRGRDIDWMWRRDNDEFAALYARERDAAVARIRGGHADPEWDEARERDEL